MGETMSRAVIEALKAELAQAKAALSEANTALSLVSGALADADCVVGPAVEFGDQVRRLAAELALAREELEAATATHDDEEATHQETLAILAHWKTTAETTKKEWNEDAACWTGRVKAVE